ncbi:MAG: flagellar biosynthetic protein FliQ [Myxococcales bacterium]|nr:flagellar biosynthetic protein FliQ [Myxococcales bacterium]
MTIDEAVWIGQQAMFTALMLAAPVLLAALLVGTLVGFVQTITQIQEVTLSFIPKMAAVFLTLAVMSGWMMQIAVGFGVTMFGSIGSP